MTELPLLIYGGTFDPVHRGHVACAAKVLALFDDAELMLMPCGDPPHRAAPWAGAEHRARMLALVFADFPRTRVDRREIERDTPSYTADTLRSLREEFGNDRPLILVLGVDAAAGLSSWHEADALPAWAHVLVLHRPGAEEEPPLRSLGWIPAAEITELRRSPAGLSWRVDVALSSASSTAVRAALREGECSPADLAPEVADYIVRHRLYAGERA